MSAPDFDDLAENGLATGVALQHRIPIEWIAKQHARNELLKRETTLAPPSGHTGFDLVFRKPPSGIKRLTICHHMLTAQKGVESRKRGHGVDLSTCINAACDRQLHFDMVRPFLRRRQG